MSNQYFENNDNLTSEPYMIEFYYRGNKLLFMSDNGVFSKHSIDFGSSLLIKNITGLQQTKSILDVGCGYGTIGITLAKANPQANIEMIDVNKRACELTCSNILRNNLNNALVFESNIYEKIDKQYDVIVTNPPIRAGKDVVHQILLNGFDYLVEGGVLWCVIQKKQGAPSAIEAMSRVYKTVDIVCKDKGYYIIKAEK